MSDTIGCARVSTLTPPQDTGSRVRALEAAQAQQQAATGGEAGPEHLEPVRTLTPRASRGYQ